MSVTFFSLALFLVCIDPTRSTSATYHIATSTNACDNVNENCQTLSQFVAGFHSASSITLILLDGNHILPADWSISNRSNVTVHPNSSAAVINCDGSPLIQFSFVQNIHISNISFIGCRMSATNIPRGLMLSNSLFLGRGIAESAVVLNNVAYANIDSCIFTSNTVGTAIGRTLPPYNVQSTVGGAIFATGSNINISRSRFENNSAGFGGSIFTYLQSSITLANSTFINNTADTNSVVDIYGSGSALYDYRGNVEIRACIFSSNVANRAGGALYFYENTARVLSSNFSNNRANHLGGAQAGISSTIFYDSIVFINNSALNWGGVLDNKHGSNITVRSCKFERNFVVNRAGGAVNTALDIVTVINSTFSHNTANQNSGGALSGRDTNFTIISCQFIGNSAADEGGALYTIGSRTKLNIIDNENTNTVYGQQNKNDGTIFINNSAKEGGAVWSSARNLIISGLIMVSNNSATDIGVFYIALTTGRISGSFVFSNNLESVVILSSDLIFDANGEFINNIHNGAIAVLQSTIRFNGSSYTLENNRRENGGAIYAVQSQLDINAPIRIENNRATENGGGIYVYQTEISCGQNCHLILEGNEATMRGGGIHAISSIIMLNAPRLAAQRRWIEFTRNSAREGGGVLLESNAEIYITQYDPDFNENRISDYTIFFQSNTASYGGAIYVDDYTNSVGACNSTSNSPTSECFFQVVSRHLWSGYGLYIIHFGFLDNRALKSGPILYGGLLDRCTISSFAEINQKYRFRDNKPTGGIEYFEHTSSIDKRDLTSGPVQVCPCVNGQQNCSYIPDIKVKKGQIFRVPLTVRNQVGHPVNATVTGYLRSTQSVLREGQLNLITTPCQSVSLRALSPHDSEQLTLYASDGPCRDTPQSSTTVNIQFIPCNLCPIGFQPEEISCECYCHDDIKDYVSCNYTTELLVRESNVWIAYINNSDIAGYLVYPYCPFGYCYGSGIPVNLNQPDGADEQCRFNRTGFLCGSCKAGLALSLGSSQCLSCPNYWPAIFLLINLAAVIAGIVLVIFLLALKLTVAVGTINGLIFYANILAVDKSILLPFAESNFATVFIAWLNLELGIDTCYYPGMDAYVKAWLQLVFPAYVILLVILVIITSNYSSRFSRMIGRSPVETLATLILLSYAKFIQTVITALSYGTLRYPDNTQDTVWLPNATVSYFSSKHIILFLVAIFILVIGLAYTALLFTWQWLPSFPNWRMFKIMNDPKFRTFMEMYTVPYKPKHRYWTGLLLLVRIALYLVAAINVSSDPRVTLASITITVGGIVILKGFIGSIYPKWEIDFIETISYLNLFFLTSFIWLALDTDINQRAITYISVIGAFILLLAIVSYHLYVHTKILSKLRNHKYCMILNVLFRIRFNQKSHHSQTPEQGDDNRLDHGLHTLLESADESINVSRSETGPKSDTRELTFSVVEMLEPTSSNTMESDNFAESREIKGK